MNTSPKFNLTPFFLLSFGIWIYCFRDFLSGKFSLTSDALAYFEHFKFFIDQISNGVYPLWDPTRDGGVPVEFFLRRIGSHNPFYFLIIVLQKLGLSFLHAYLSFLAFYFFLGTVGFYCVAKQIFKDSLTAFVAFLFILFSSLGTRIFDSYIILTFTPLMWCFYFWAGFFHSVIPTKVGISPQVDPRFHGDDKFYFTGGIFTLMILCNTYLPFYFAVILATFILSLAVCYWSFLKASIQKFVSFINHHRLFSIFWIMLFLISLLPGILFFSELSKGDIELPLRHSSLTSANALEVDPIWVTKWGLEEDLVYSQAYLNDLKHFKFAVLYVPVFVWVILGMGMLIKCGRGQSFFLIWMLLLFFLSAQQFPVYDFLNQHIFFFKYFRNLHFFLWLALLPIFIIFTVDQLKMMKEQWSGNRNFMLWTVMVHLVLLAYILNQTQPIAGTLISLGLSLLLLVGWFSGRIKSLNLVLSAFLLLMVIEPIQVFHNLGKNEGVIRRNPYRYEKPYLEMRLPEKPEWMDERELQDKKLLTQNKIQGGYLGLKWFNLLHQQIDPSVFSLGNYLKKKFIVYDQAEWMSLNMDRWEDIIQTLFLGRNKALISTDEKDRKKAETLIQLGNRMAQEKGFQPKARIVTQGDANFKIDHFDVNRIQFKTHFDSMKFLVYNDGYHPKWRARIDGKSVDVWQANAAFKGLWIPAGEHNIEFQYASPWEYGLNAAMLMIFGLSLMRVLWGSWKLKNA